MASTSVESSHELNQLFTDISSKFSSGESEDVVKSSKRIYEKQFDSLENQDVLSCLGLLRKLGYVSNTKLNLIIEFFAPKSNKEKDSETIDNFMFSHPLQADPERELQGRSDDFRKIMEKLETGQPAVVNLHGSAGVGKTTLAKVICSKWRGKPYIFDLREAKDMRAIYLNIMKNLDLTVPVGYLSESYVVDRILEHCIVKEGDGQPVLFLLDNVEPFTLGQGKEGKNLRTAFMQFLGKLLECDDSGKMRPLRVLLTSRTQLNDTRKVADHELHSLKESDSEKNLLPKEMADLNTEQKEKLVAVCNRKPLFLKGVQAILQQGRKAPSDQIDELEKLIHMATKEKADTPVKSKLEEDSKEKPFDLEQEGVDRSEQSVMKEMFNTLPSDSLKESAVSISLFCGPFTVSTAAKVLGISPAEAVAQLEGLETSAIVFVVNREAKELKYDIHPLLRKYVDSIKSDDKFAEFYSKARARFYEHFMSEMKTIAGFVESDYVKAFILFANDQPNYEFATEISLLPEFFSVPGEFHDNALIASLVYAVLSNEKQRELFHSWAEMAKKCHDKMKDLASSVGDHDRVKLYQDALLDMINTGKKPGPTLRPKESQVPSSKECFDSTHESDSDEDKVIAVGSKEGTEVTSQQEVVVEHKVEKGSKEECEVEEIFEEEIQTTSEEKHGVGGFFSGMDISSTIINRFALGVDVVRRLFAAVKDLLSTLYRRHMSLWAGFKACLCEDVKPNKCLLKLFCYPIHMENQVKDFSSEYPVLYQGEGTSSVPLCGQDKMSVNLSESFSAKQEDIETFSVVFLEDWPNQSSLRVSIVEFRDLHVKIYQRSKGEETTEVCTLFLIRRSPVQVSSHAIFEHWPQGDLQKRQQTMGMKILESIDNPVSKEGSPSRDELEWLSLRLGVSWEPLARRLGFHDGDITGFRKDNEEYAKKALSMLFKWKEREGSGASYKLLYEALCHEFVKRKDLAEDLDLLQLQL